MTLTTDNWPQFSAGELHPWDLEPAREVNYLCTIPRPLGRVTKLEFIHGKLVARTESGMTFICPTSKIFGNAS